MMQIQFLRSATMVIRSADHVILLDPMLADQGAMSSFTVIRHKARKNPLVPLPPGTDRLLAEVNGALVTHCQRGHVDHLDKAGMAFLAAGRIPTWCRPADARFLKKKGLDARAVSMEPRQDFLGGHITLVPAVHGHGWIGRMMGPGVGFFIELPGEPSLYVAGDTVMTDHVRNALTELKPDIAVVAAGNASIDVGKPILMSLDEVIEFARLAPGRVVANHLEALNHCPVTREDVRRAATAAGLGQKIEIPDDGQQIDFGGRVVQ